MIWFLSFTIGNDLSDDSKLEAEQSYDASSRMKSKAELSISDPSLVDIQIPSINKSK